MKLGVKKINNIDTAVVMCGGQSTGFNHVCKPLIYHRDMFIIQYVFEALHQAGVRRVILKSNHNNEDLINYVAQKVFDNYEMVATPTERMREALQTLEEHLDGEFYMVVGNQPMEASHFYKMQQMRDRGFEWVVSLYDPCYYLEKQSWLISATKKDSGELELVPKKDHSILQHPFILTPDIIEYQRQENFSNKIEQTIANLLCSKRIGAVKAEMPPEFDSWTEFKSNTISYIDRVLRNSETNQVI